MEKVFKKILHIFLGVMFVAGVLVTIYPFMSNFINQITNESHIDDYNNDVALMDEQTKNDILSKAYEYNKMVATDYYLENNDISEKYQEIANSYDDILNFEDSLIGYIEIPKISVKLPIYHETKKYALTMGAIHSQRSSFPIGGSDTHSVISAHSAYPSQRFFDDIDELVVGDEFSVKILNDTLTYRVTDINIVEPSDSSKLRVQEGKDLVTLCTCYPYSVNTHRLLVTGERTTDKKSINQNVKTQNTQSQSILEIFVTAGFFVIAYLIVFFVRFCKK